MLETAEMFIILRISNLFRIASTEFKNFFNSIASKTISRSIPLNISFEDALETKVEIFLE